MVVGFQFVHHPAIAWHHIVQKLYALPWHILWCFFGHFWTWSPFKSMDFFRRLWWCNSTAFYSINIILLTFIINVMYSYSTIKMGTKKTVCCSVLFTTIEVYLRVISFPYVPHSIMSGINRIFSRFQKKPQSLAKCSTNAWGLWDWVKRAWRKEEVVGLKLYTNVFPLFDVQRKKCPIITHAWD